MLIPTTPACAQDQPSLAMWRARPQGQEKNNAQPKKVITDDTSVERL